ncbi:MAG: AtpZ/AtpI family protein [Bacillota bacterium]|nr:AtpZ/AtpI family protein [Bacillota bacterium]
MKIDRAALWAYAKYANIALSFGVTTAVSILLGYWGGNWVDRRLGTFPIFMVLGVLLGVGASFKSLFDLVAALERLEGRRKSPRRGRQRRR